VTYVGISVWQPSSADCHLPQFFTEYGEANRYSIKEVIGKGSYGVVCSAVDTKSGEKVAIKKINNVFDHVSDATRILREIKLLRLLRHPGALPGHRRSLCTLHQGQWPTAVLLYANEQIPRSAASLAW